MKPTQAERNYNAKKSLAFLIFLAVVFFSGFPKWINVQVRKLALDEPNFELNPYEGRETNVFDETWQLRDLSGERSDFQNFRDRTLIVNFWATWCLPCLAEMESLIEMDKALGGDVKVLFVTTDDKDAVREYASEKGIADQVYYPEALPAEFNHKAIPATYLISKSGKILFFHMGSADWNDEQALGKIRHLISQD